VLLWRHSNLDRIRIQLLEEGDGSVVVAFGKEMIRIQATDVSQFLLLLYNQIGKVTRYIQAFSYPLTRIHVCHLVQQIDGLFKFLFVHKLIHLGRK